MVGKSERFSSRYSCCVRQSAENMDSSDKLPGTSGRVDIDDSCLPRSKPISLDIDRSVLDGIRVVHIPVSRMSSPDKRRLVTQLKTELQKIDKWQKKITKATTFGHCVKLSPTVQTPQMKCGNAEPEQILKHPKETRKRAIDEVYVSPCTGDQGEKHAHLLQTPQLKSANAGKFEIKKQILPTKATNRFDLIMNDCKKLNSCLMSQNDSWVFNESVDPVKLKLPDYFDIIKHPMDLGTIQTKLSSGAYMSPFEFMHDVRLTFSNAMTYNLPENIVHDMAIRMSNFFEIRWKCIEKKLAAFDQGNKISKPESQSKKLKTLAIPTIAVPEILERKKQHMTIKNKQRLSQVIQTWIAEIPENVVDFLKSRNANQISEDELEIDLETLDDEALSELQELMVEFVKLRTNKEIDTTNYETEVCFFV